MVSNDRLQVIFFNETLCCEMKNSSTFELREKTGVTNYLKMKMKNKQKLNQSVHKIKRNKIKLFTTKKQKTVYDITLLI